MFHNNNINRIIVKLSVLLFYTTIVKSREYCINSEISVCSGLQEIPISKDKISEIRSLDYFLNPEAEMKREQYPDQLALSMIQAKGLCNYGGEKYYIADIPEIRYALSYSCYYAYQELQCDDSEKDKTSSKVKKHKLPKICKKQCYQFYNSLVTFLNNNDLCPFEFQEDYVHPDDVYKARVKFTDKLREICDKAEDSDDCFLVNKEKSRCGK